MRSFFCHVACLIFPLAVVCQNLEHSSNHSLTAKVYRISNKQALKIYEKGVWEIDSTYFQQLVDEYHSDSIYRQDLPHGQYIHVKSVKDRLRVRLEASSDLQTYIFNNGQEAKIEIQNTNGQLIQNAEVRFGSKKLQFDHRSKSYLLKGKKRQGVLSVTYDGNTIYQTIGWSGSKFSVKYLPAKLLRTSPVRYLWMPFRDGVRSIGYGEEVGYISRIADWFRPWGDKWNKEYEDKFSGYILFNKPTFRPGDTVKLKAFITDKKGHPVERDLQVRISGRKIDKVLGNPRTYTKGAYTFDFVLHDSLTLRTDQTYSISLQLKKHKELISDHVKLEYYELKSANYTLRVAHKHHLSNESNAIFMEGKDANDFNLLDGRYKLLLRTNDVKSFSPNKVFVPDTLWYKEGKLDPFGETRVNVPNEIFPKARLTYDVEAIFLNTENEQQTKNEYISYDFGSEKIDMRLKEDSLFIDYLIDSISQTVEATIISVVAQTGAIKHQRTSLPAKIKIKSNVETYTVNAGDLTNSISLQSEDPKVHCSTSRTPDSLFVKINSARGLHFKYDVFYGQKKLASGSGQYLDYRVKTKGKKNYFVSVQYLWGGREVSEQYDVPFYDKELDIRLITPSTVYPGQKASIKVLATDKAGTAAKGTDVSITGITNKFKFNRIPTLNYYGKRYAPFARHNQYEKNHISNSNQSKKMNFDWWERKLHLDTMAYYNFLYPKSGFYKKQVVVSDSLTQFSPFVVENGILQPVHVIYLDGSPIYFRGVNAEERYSFLADSGYHSIKLRTVNRLVTIDSLNLTYGKKLIFNVDIEKENRDVFVQKMPVTLTQQELAFLSKYMALITGGFNSRDAFIQQWGHYQLLSRQAGRRYNRFRLVGPFYNAATSFNLKDRFENDFHFEPNYLYEFRAKLVKMKEVETESYLTLDTPFDYEPSFNDAILTRAEILDLWNQMDQNALLTRPVYNNPKSTRRGFGRLGIDFSDKENETEQLPVNILISKIQDDDFTRVYPGAAKMIRDLEPGRYNLVGVYDNSSYFKIDSLEVLGDGATYHRFSTLKINPPDSFSIKVKEIIVATFKLPFSHKRDREKDDLYQIKRAFNNTFGYSGPMRMVYGHITDENGTSIPGVNVIVKGTTIGTTTDIDGNYAIQVPIGAELVVSFIGLVPQETEVGNRSQIDLHLQSDYMELSEVVVTAQGVRRSEKSLGYSVATVTAADIQGNIPGLNINATSGTNGSSLTKIIIRGNSSISGMNTPLFVVDGVPQASDPRLDPTNVHEITILKGLEATVIYGEQAVNGVILITTNSIRRKPNAQLQASLGALQGVEADEMSSIRSNFSDYAIWQPDLTTDENGLAEFDVTFPDDITSWNVHALAMGQKKTTGTTNTTIRSFKPVSANLAMTRFLIEGDSLNAIGKSLNYEGDSSLITTEFKLNDTVVGGQEAWLSTSIIDTLKVTATNTDTLQMTYKLTRVDDDYFDGEQRSIPVYPQGVKETHGHFYKLTNDTTIQVAFDPSLGVVTLHAESNLINVVLDEINFVGNYKYLCNEQTASKLKALIYHREIIEHLGQKFEAAPKVKKLIRRLERTQNTDGSWGWWGDNTGQMWTTVHVLEAITLARKKGFHTNVDLERLMESSIYWLDSESDAESRFFSRTDKNARLRLMKVLADLKKPFDHARYLKPFHTDTTMTQVDYLRFTALKQLLGMSIDLDSIQSLKKTTILGNYYWGEESADLFENSIEASALVYDILSRTGQHDNELPHIRDYFLEQRKAGHWRNTYESVRVISAVLSDILKTDGTDAAELVMQGPLNKTITEFPSTVSFQPTEDLSFTKKGSNSIYVSATQESWNKSPEEDTTSFNVRAAFIEHRDTVKTLTAGTKVKYSVSVLVKKKAKHVLLEVPIPAGVSYHAKPQRGSFVESGREYYENSTSIFCQELKPGVHTFEIELIPRYSGTFHVNPVNVELMYFPTFKGRNQIETVEIK